MISRILAVSTISEHSMLWLDLEFPRDATTQRPSESASQHAHTHQLGWGVYQDLLSHQRVRCDADVSMAQRWNLARKVQGQSLTTQDTKPQKPFS